MFWLYRLCFLPALLVMLPAYARRMRRRGATGKVWPAVWEREALPPKRPGLRRVWLQAVSVGEMLAVGPILESLHRSGCRFT